MFAVCGVTACGSEADKAQGANAEQTNTGGNTPAALNAACSLLTDKQANEHGDWVSGIFPAGTFAPFTPA